MAASVRQLALASARRRDTRRARTTCAASRAWTQRHSRLTIQAILLREDEEITLGYAIHRRIVAADMNAAGASPFHGQRHVLACERDALQIRWSLLVVSLLRVHHIRAEGRHFVKVPAARQWDEN